MDTSKKLYLSTTDKKVSGVCGGLAEYFNADATLIRVLAVLLILFTFPLGLIAYVVMAIVTPKNPGTTTPVDKN